MNFNPVLQMNKIILAYINVVEGNLAIANGLAIPNTPPFMVDTDNMAFFHR